MGLKYSCLRLFSCRQVLNVALVFAVMVLLSEAVAVANTARVDNVNAALDPTGGGLTVSADIRYGLSQAASEALNNGVPLFWEVSIKVLRPRPWLWDQVLSVTLLRYRLEYHALLNVYRVTLEHQGQAYNVPSLAAALAVMSSLRGLQVLDKKALASEQHLVVKAQVVFDRSSLPMPLRPFAYFNREWDLSSEWTVWAWKK